ncbi:phytoene desaturase family protein [Gloeocapsopsis crepidinum]|uniref:phytoene desaturase family protein n=1 Tax=Gloeocapsopsis crepidinum TaxID=693223 RepID=UPI003F7196C1
MFNSNQFDVIVIGSGIGGLTTAAILAKFNHKKVLILEQHFIVGGFTQEFKHKGFQWDIGVQAVTEMAKGDIGRIIFDYITDGKLQWQKLPNPSDTLVYPDFTFNISSNPQGNLSDLVRMFPHEKASLRRYFSDLKKVTIWYRINLIANFAPQWLKKIIKPFLRQLVKTAHLTAKEYVERNFHNPQLKALLTSQWGAYGLPPSQISFGIHAVAMTSYGKGSWYPVGGSQAIVECILPTITKVGGRILTQRQVTEIIVKNGVAIGVKARKTHDSTAEPEIYHAPIIISDAGAFNTYTKLLSEEYATTYCHQIKAFPKGYSMLFLFVGLKESPETLNLGTANYWIFNSYNHDQALQEQVAAPDKVINSCMLSFPSLKNHTTVRHTCEIIVYADYNYFEKWQSQPWKKRSSDYYKLKEKIAQKIIGFIEEYYPGFKELIEYYELATPLSVEYFIASDRGSLYGIPAIPKRFTQEWISPKTPIKNLYLSGTDALIHGIVGATIAGVLTTGIINGWFGFFKVMFAIIFENQKYYRKQCQ